MVHSLTVNEFADIPGVRVAVFRLEAEPEPDDIVAAMTAIAGKVIEMVVASDVHTRFAADILVSLDEPKPKKQTEPTVTVGERDGHREYTVQVGEGFDVRENVSGG